MAIKRDCCLEPAAWVAIYLWVFLSKLSHLALNSKNTSSKLRICPAVSKRVIPIDFNAVSTLFISASSICSPSISSLTSPKRAIIVFIAVPKFSGASRVVSIILVKNTSVDWRLIPAFAAIDAVLVNAVINSSDDMAALASNAAIESVTLFASSAAIL